jgi:hypothetical protein
MSEPVPDSRYRILAVVHQDHGVDDLVAAVRQRAKGRTVEIAVVAPALTSRLRCWTSDLDEGIADATAYAHTAAEALRTVGMLASARVGDADPVQAIDDVLRDYDANELIITPREHPHWSERRLVERVLRRHPALPITRLRTVTPLNEQGWP